MIRRLFSFFLALALLCPTSVLGADAPKTDAKAAILIDAKTGRVLAAHNADEPMLIASTTKIMTALVVLECTKPDDIVTIPAEAHGVEGSSMYARAGQKYPVSEVLGGLMLLSGNDAAVALAIHCAGSLEAFTERMNAKAAELDMKQTVFRNPHGLWDENISTAQDMAMLMRAAMSSEAFASLASQKHARVGSMTARNHHRLLWTLPGCDGGKTGFTKKAGRCLVTSVMRDGARFIIVTLNDGNDWRDHTVLAEHAFSEYPCETLARSTDVYHVPVIGGTLNAVNLHPSEDIILPLRASELERVQLDVRLPRYFWAPVQKYQPFGTIRASLDGTTLSEVSLISGSYIPVRAKRRTSLGKKRSE